jgi:hypothetical protein
MVPCAPPLSFSRRVALAFGCLVLSLVIVPRRLSGRGAGALFDGDLDAQDALARPLSADVLAHGRGVYYPTGVARFDGQSAVAIDQMTLLALGQILLEHPEKRAEYLPAMRAAADRLVDPATLRYAASVYGRHACQGMGPGQGHAYAGYINMGLGMLRLVEPDTPHARLHDRLNADLQSRLFQAQDGLFETYPGETWPPDVAVVAGSIGLHARATGADVEKEMDTWAERFARCALDASGYLVQRVQSGTCKPSDAPRGSGTALASYAIGFAHRGLSRRLYQALVDRGRVEIFGFTGIREYAEGFHGSGDVNAGPIVFGASVGATGFALGAARMNGDRDLYERLYRSTDLAGIPVDMGGRGTTFVAGGVLGNALLLAMLTARAP